ncbi:hypothetical protein KC872_00150 [Candidatus Kaiserbacteria bacterium]|nr:hypothetical protein [Candidatus Kaiserbacteria bacterium]
MKTRFVEPKTFDQIERKLVRDYPYLQFKTMGRHGATLIRFTHQEGEQLNEEETGMIRVLCSKVNGTTIEYMTITPKAAVCLLRHQQ